MNFKIFEYIIQIIIFFILTFGVLFIYLKLNNLFRKVPGKNYHPPIITNSEKYFSNFQKNKYKFYFEINQRYITAKNVLDNISYLINDPDKDKFIKQYEHLIGIEENANDRLWDYKDHFKTKKTVFINYLDIISIINFIKNNTWEDHIKIFDKCGDKLKNIPGINVDLITEIMHTYSPEKFCIINARIKAAIKILDPESILPELKKFTGHDYMELFDLLSILKNHFSFETYREVDNFISYVESEEN